MTTRTSWRRPILREVTPSTATIANGAALSDAIDFREHSMMVIHMPAAWTAASIGFQVSATEGGTYQPLYDDDGVLLQISNPAVSQSHVAPPKLAAAGFVKLWSQNGSGTSTNQAAERSLGVDIKS